MAIGHWNASVTDLVPSYRNTRRILEQCKGKYAELEKKDRWDPVMKAELEKLGSMISDCDYVLEWIRIGGNPDRRKGAEKRYVTTWDPAWLDAYHSPNGWSIERESRELTDTERFKINEAMRELSDRERQCYLLYHVDGMSMGEIALELHLGKSTVQEFLERAKLKIENAKLTSLFLLE